MWVFLVSLDCKEAIEWQTEAENEFFLLQEGFDTSTSTEQQQQKQKHNRGKGRASVFYRILMKGNTNLNNVNNLQNTINNHNNTNNSKKKGKEAEVFDLPVLRTRIIAVSPDWQTIDNHWRWIEENILLFFGYFDRTSPREEQELWYS